MKKARIIYNPTAGREAFKKELPEVLEQLERAGYETSTHATTCEGDACLAATHACKHQFDLVVAVGGDGTINEIINGIAKEEYRPKIGIIPAGTTNDFARALDIPRNILKATEIIVQDHSMHIDIGLVNERYFMNIAGGGELTELTYEVPSKLKTVLGQLAYYLKGMEMLPFIKPTHTRIEYDGNVIDEEIMLFLLANTNSVGGFEKLAPKAKINDGYFDLLILRKANLAEFIRIATQVLRGAHLEDQNVIYTQAKDVKVIPQDRMQLNIDGEYGGLLPGAFHNLQQHIEFFVPESFLADYEAEEEVEEVEEQQKDSV
ncbi:MAG TPA: diacylglycerol kinase [Bacillota bacterium]|nr:diacylglycerol kinase [Bacillota bacterium]